MRKKLELILLVVLLLVLSGALVYHRSGVDWFGEQSAAVPLKEFTSAEHGIFFIYPATFQTTNTSDEATRIGTFFRATHGGAGLLTVRREQGLGVLKITGSSIIDSLLKNIDRRYPDQYPNYHKLSLEDITVGAEKGSLIEFTYTGKDGQTLIREQLVIIVVRDSDAYFFSFQAPDASFAARQPLFQTVLDSVDFTKPTVPTR